MKENLSKPSRLLPLWALLPFWAIFPQILAADAAAMGEVQSYKFNLEKAVGARLSKSQAFQLEAVLVEKESAIEGALRFNNTSRDYMGLQVGQGNPQAIESSIRITATSGSKPIVEECSAWQSGCSRIKVKEDTGKYVFSIAGGEFKLSAGSTPCLREQERCSLSIPSWALNWMVANGTLPSVPGLLMIIQLQNKIAFFDATSGHRFMVLPVHDKLRSLGKLSGAEFNRDKTLRMIFARGSALLDFTNDQMLIADSSGLQLSKKGISGGANPEFTRIHSTSGADISTPLFVNSSIVRWPQELVVLKKDMSGRIEGAQTRPAESTKVSAVYNRHSGLYAVATMADGSVELQTIDDRSGAVENRKKYSLLGGAVQLPNSTFLGDLLVQKTQKGYARSNGGPAAEFLPQIGAQQVKLLPGGHIFLPVQSSGGCQLVHEVQDEQSPETFHRSGFSLPCNFAGKVKTSFKGVYVFDLQSDITTTQVWLPVTRP
ncbi:hypothetical protein EBR21_01110 [bacterium]|nr:hypothetical protein [bacterium]